ncbi:MAG: hypothetical protein QM662_02415 [Gordonia sp. (in: high G+C Gram-positive bacteria)]
MTVPTTLDSLTLEEQCEAIWAATLAEELRLQRIRETPPALFVFDGYQQLQHVLLDCMSVHVEDIEDDTGQIELELPFEHPVAQWMHDTKGRLADGHGEFFHVDVEHCGVRITGRYESKEVRKDAKGQRTLHVVLLTDYENLKWVDLWSNPFLPAVFQFPRIFLLAGPAIWALKTALFLNLWRINSSVWQIPDDPLDPSSWLDGLDMSTWDVVVSPTTFVEDIAASTTWCLVMSRWQKWHDVAEMILKDAELSVVTRRYRAGDPEPWEGADIKDGALVVDIVDKSGQMEGTANGGTIFDGLTRTVREIGADFIEDTEEELTGSTSWPTQFFSDMFGTPKGFPFVHFPADSGTETSFTETPAKGLIINCGGQSAPGVNEAISAGIQTVGDLATSNMNINGYGIGAQGGAIDAVLKPFYTDTVAAWMSTKLVNRAALSGDSHYYEYHLDLPGKAYTLSSVMAIRSGIVATARKKTGTVKFPAAGPYMVGWPGSGHLYKGDRGSFEIPGDTTGEIHVQRAMKAIFDWSAKDFALWELEFGRKDDEDPVVRLQREIANVAKAASELGVW